MKLDRLKFPLVVVLISFIFNCNSVSAQDTIKRLPSRSFIPLFCSPESYSVKSKEELKKDSLFQVLYTEKRELKYKRFLLKIDSCQKIADALNERYSGRNFLYYVSYGQDVICGPEPDESQVSIVKKDKWNPGSENKIYYQDNLWDGLYFHDPIR